MKVGTLFSGIGAPEEALKEMGVEHEVEFACDIDDKAQATYLQNHQCRQFFNDIKAIRKAPPVDLLVFGFPCQAFSLAGHRKGLLDERGQLVLDAIRILRQTKPRWFVAENVANLTKLEGGKTFAFILRRLRRSGYRVSWAILNSLDFGVPQSRRRVWIVGQRKDSVVRSFVFPKGAGELVPLARVLDILPKANGTARFFATEEFLAKPKVVKAMANYRHDFAQCLTGTIARNGSSSEYISYVAAVKRAIGQARKPTPRECLRLHGFPESFQFPVGVEVTSQYCQTANTMTVPVVRAILERLIA